MIFKEHKYYLHTSGRVLHTLSNEYTHIWGHTLLAEDTDGDVISVGTDSEDYAVNWTEITEDEFRVELPDYGGAKC